MKITANTIETLEYFNEEEKALRSYYIVLSKLANSIIKWVNLPWCYTDTDCVRYCESDVEVCKEMINALYGSKQAEKENKKMTNGEKMKEVFGTNNNLKQCVAGLFNPEYDCTGVECENCPYWSENWFKAEYKAPKKVTQRRAKFFSSLDELLFYVHEHEISESDVINVTKSGGLSSVNWCLTYNQHLYETPTVQTFEGRIKND